jgi:hypothetical protein
MNLLVEIQPQPEYKYLASKEPKLFLPHINIVILIISFN